VRSHPEEFAGLIDELRVSVQVLQDAHNQTLEVLEAGEI
jgi:hypothetical protein